STGLCPWFGFTLVSLISTIRAAPEPGAQPSPQDALDGEAEPSPHIGRRSRSENIVRNNGPENLVTARSISRIPSAMARRSMDESQNVLRCERATGKRES